MTPQEAGFENKNGLKLPNLGSTAKVKLMASSSSPISSGIDYSGQLVWYTPPNQAAMLLYCNDDGQWFNLQFQPIN